MSLATMLELEASNCSMSLHDACASLLPIMQLVVSRTHPQLSDCSGKFISILFVMSIEPGYRIIRYHNSCEISLSFFCI